jgi:methylmalonyl-CoA mutase
MAELAERGGEHIVVVCGGVIPPKDHAFLTEAGVAAVFGPGTNIIEAARAVLAVPALRKTA